MSQPANFFDSLSGVPVHYDRPPLAPYGSRGVPHRFHCTDNFETKLNGCFTELWQVCPLGRAEVITSAGAFVDKPGFHGRGEAFDLDGLHWAGRAFVTLNYPSDSRFYLGVEAVLRKHFGTVLDYHYNPAHRDHLHIDTGGEVGFNRSLKSKVFFLQAALTEVLDIPVGIDGVWGDETSGAAAQALTRLGISGQLETKAVWLQFLSQIATRGFGAAPVITIEPTVAELLRKVYSIISLELAENPVRKQIEGALTAFVSHPDLKRVLNLPDDNPGPEAGDKQTRILKIAADSECAKHDWKDRGRAPIGYIKGMALVYAKCYSESKGEAESAVTVMKQPLLPESKDGLAWYKAKLEPFQIDFSNETERLRTLFTLLVGLGMRESSGNTTEGRDTTATEPPTAGNAEAGLFQTSFDSFNASPALAILFEQYKAGTNKCFLDVFMEKVRDRNSPVVGTGKGAEYQRLTKQCPAFAAEYAAVMLRVSRKHFGPINRREAEFLGACREMLKAIEAEVDRR